MDKLQLFFSNFYRMTFEDKGAFWGIVLAITLLVLTYAFSEKLRHLLKRKTKFLILVPVLLLACFALLLANSCKYVPLSERSEPNTVSYEWEQRIKKTENTLIYRANLRDPSTGSAREQSYAFGEILGRFSSKETSDHVAEEYTIISSDKGSSMTFTPDGTYVFRTADGATEETGRYTYAEKTLILTSNADGAESKVGKTSSKLRYTSSNGAAKGEFGVKELKDKFVIEETVAYVQEAYSAVSTDESTTFTFQPDGTYIFRAEDGTEETGHYVYRGDELVLANAEGDEAFRKNFSGQVLWLVFAAAVAVLMVMIFIFQPQIKIFLNRHPMIWLLIPAAFLIYFVYVAIGWNVWVSVSDWPDGRLEPSYGWGGFGQYAKMFSDGAFWSAVLNTLKLFLIIPICLLLGMGLALIMDQGLKATPVFRTLILLPFALSFVVTGLIWQQMFNGNGGILVEFFKLFGISENIQWTSNEMVMYSIMLVMVWQFSGYVAVIFLAAIKNVPVNTINAAKLDGAYMPRVYWKMILPQMKGAMGSCITILAMYALRSFDLIYSLTSYTNPASSTLPIMMYNQMYAHNNFAYAAAISVFLLAMVLVLILPLTYATNRGKK
ncbi:MAG: sugar ABC transporter permease [Clostridia bacterium]|nr:sugar ABC transporter permease [Clostridia bacterium]